MSASYQELYRERDECVARLRGMEGRPGFENEERVKALREQIRRLEISMAEFKDRAEPSRGRR
jgi:hypothetical protein